MIKKDTIINLLMWLVPITILICVVYFDSVFRNGDANSYKVEIYLSNIERALGAFRHDVGRYPLEDEGLNALVSNPGLKEWQGPYVGNNEIKDMWGSPYKFISIKLPHGIIVLFVGSSGKNGKWETTRDDLIKGIILGDDKVISIEDDQIEKRAGPEPD